MKRLQRHNNGLVRGSRGKAPYRLVYLEVFETRKEAMWREWELKTKWNTARKKRLIDGYDRSRLHTFAEDR